ncbi:hypothetical protein [Amycolatopsis minnesotensis]|uniref:Uncharacterized protein n=1 Tax=Amycolatopsis minnesotensis TaxID=337894 RepID=A0ABN2QDE0_9PSEU
MRCPDPPGRRAHQPAGQQLGVPVGRLVLTVHWSTTTVEIRHGDHGSSTLFAELPSGRAQALYAACDQDAHEKKRQGDKRTMDQYR